MLIPLLLSPDALTDREREAARWHPERETLEPAATGAATVLGARHSATRAFARAAATMDRVDLWRARLALRTLRIDKPAPSSTQSKGTGAFLLPPEVHYLAQEIIS